LRDTATITYEPEATDEELQQLEDNRLGLLNTYNRQIWEEASAVFYGQNFHFTLPRPVNRIAADQGTFHSILAAEAFLRHRRLSRNHIRELEFDLWQQTGDPGQDVDTYIQGEVMVLARRPDLRSDRDLLWTNGLDRLGRLATILNGLPNFQHLRLNFRDLAPPWYNLRILVSGQTSD
jgi:hypothetical protein